MIVNAVWMDKTKAGLLVPIQDEPKLQPQKADPRGPLELEGLQRDEARSIMTKLMHLLDSRIPPHAHREIQRQAALTLAHLLLGPGFEYEQLT